MPFLCPCSVATVGFFLFNSYPAHSFILPHFLALSLVKHNTMALKSSGIKRKKELLVKKNVTQSESKEEEEMIVNPEFDFSDLATKESPLDFSGAYTIETPASSLGIHHRANSMWLTRCCCFCFVFVCLYLVGPSQDTALA